MLLTALAVGLCISAAVAIAVVLTIDSDKTAAQAGFNALAFLLFGLTAAAGTSALDRPRARWLGGACIAISVAGFTVTTVMIWSTGDEPPEGLEKAFESLFVAALALVQVSLLARGTDTYSRRAAAVDAGTQLAALLLAGLLIGAILGEVEDETYQRLVGVAAVLWLLGTALVPLARRVARRA
jgi:hypothetical protein